MLPALAAQSGGQVLYGSTDLPGLIDRCVADANSYYVVTYDMPAARHEDEYHAIKSRSTAQVWSRYPCRLLRATIILTNRSSRLPPTP